MASKPATHILPMDSYRYDEDASTRLKIAIYRVKSQRDPAVEHTVRYEFRNGQWFCDHPSRTLDGGTECSDCIHIRTVEYWQKRNSAYRAYMAMPIGDLLNCDRLHRDIRAGLYAGTTGWTVEDDALADALAARWGEIASAA